MGGCAAVGRCAKALMWVGRVHRVRRGRGLCKHRAAAVRGRWVRRFGALRQGAVRVVRCGVGVLEWAAGGDRGARGRSFDPLQLEPSLSSSLAGCSTPCGCHPVAAVPLRPLLCPPPPSHPPHMHRSSLAQAAQPPGCHPHLRDGSAHLRRDHSAGAAAAAAAAAAGGRCRGCCCWRRRRRRRCCCCCCALKGPA